MSLMNNQTCHALRRTAPLVLLTSSIAFGQPAEGLLSTDPGAPVNTEVAANGFQRSELDPDEETEATVLNLSGGGMFMTGNSKLTAVTAAGRFRARRGDNQISSAAAANYTRAELDGNYQTTVRNFQGQLRFDRFVGRGFATFLAMSARNDRFQGLILRLNLDPGLAYYFLDAANLQLWSELGYDYQYDVRRLSAVEAARDDGTDLARTEERHSGRLFLGYNNSVNDAVVVHMGVEYLQALPDTDYWRLNGELGLTSQIANRLSISTTFGLRYDNHPLPGFQTTDTVTTATLNYQLL